MWRAGEVAAVQYLVKQGWTIVARNWRCSLGELDIVARTPGPDPVLVFCEVKCRSGLGFGDPLDGWRLGLAIAAFMTVDKLETHKEKSA